MAGVQGNGQSELVEAILGVLPVSRGTVTLDGRAITGLTPKQTIDAGVGCRGSVSRAAR